MALLVTRDAKTKSLPFHSVSRCELSGGALLLQAGERAYEMKGQRVEQVVEVFRMWTFFRDYQEVPEQKMQKPKSIDYHTRATQAKKEQ
jgi:hypothetical protein